MKNEKWTQLGCMLETHGFRRHRSQQQDASIAWFSCASPDPAVVVYLRFVLKPKLRVLTGHIGWRHEAAHKFCLAAIKEDWPQGFSWLTDAGVLSAPCLSIFNLADHMGWSLAGIPVDGPREVFESAELRFGKVISSNDWTTKDTSGLLEFYVNDNKPFDWKASNSAIRIAEIAGLCAAQGSGVEKFDICAEKHSALMRADMFGLGSNIDWTKALRRRFLAEESAGVKP